MRISGATTVCGIVGDPIEHSLSPAMQNAAFEAVGVDYVYVPFRLRRGAANICTGAMRALGVRGLNVTVPHKVDIIRHLDWVERSAMRIGAVNTILCEEGRLYGYNTDAPGFVRSLESCGVDVGGMEVVVMGAGGAARAVVFSLVDRGACVTVLNRDEARAASLADDVAASGFRVSHGALTDRRIEAQLLLAGLLVNATSVGMHPRRDESPCPRRYLRRDLVVCDLVYNPPETMLLRDAATVGAATINGVEMLVQQGALAFELWTGVRAPVDVMRSVVCKELGYDSH